MFLVLFNLGVAGLVAVVSWKDKAYRFFSLSIVALTAYEISSLLSDFPFGQLEQSYLIKADFVFGLLAAFLYFLFAQSLTMKSHNFSTIYTAVLGITTALFAILALFSNQIIKRVHVYDYGVDFSSGLLDYLFVVFIITEISIALSLLLKRHKTTQAVERMRSKYILAGSISIVSTTIVFLLLERLLITSEILEVGVSAKMLITRIGDLGVIAFVGITGYGILRHRLFGIRVWLGRTVFWLGVSLFGLVSAYVIALLESRLLGSIFSLPVMIINLFVALFFALLLAFTENYWRKQINIWTGKISFDEEELLEIFKSEIAKVQDTEDRLGLFLNYINRLFGPSKIAVLAFKEEDEMLSLYEGFNEGDKKLLEDENNLNRLINGIGTDVLNVENFTEDSSLLLLLKALNINLVLSTHDKEMVVLLGAPRTGEYNHKGSRLLRGLLMEACS